MLNIYFVHSYRVKPDSDDVRITPTKEIIEKTIQAYAADDAYWLKFYASDINVKILDAIKMDKGEEAILENLKRSDFGLDISLLFVQLGFLVFAALFFDYIHQS